MADADLREESNQLRWSEKVEGMVDLSMWIM